VCQRGHTANRDWRDVRPSVDGSRGVRRVSTDWHTAKMGVRRVPSPGTRQTITAVRPPDGRRVCPARDPCSPCAYWLTHGEDQGLPCAGPWHTAKSKVSRVFFLCRVFFWRHTAKEVFAVYSSGDTRRRFWHTAKYRFPVVQVQVQQAGRKFRDLVV